MVFVHSKSVVQLLLICCLVCFPLVVGVLCLSLFCCALLCVLSTFAIILKRKRELFALLLMSCRCHVSVYGVVGWSLVCYCVFS